jgi:hypothetical protein
MPTPAYIFKRTPSFRRAFDNLNPDQQQAAKKAFQTFKKNPFDPSLNPHKINRLSAIYKKTVLSVTIKGDLKSVFYVDGGVVVSLDIGTHDIYK